MMTCTRLSFSHNNVEEQFELNCIVVYYVATGLRAAIVLFQVDLGIGPDNSISKTGRNWRGLRFATKIFEVLIPISFSAVKG